MSRAAAGAEVIAALGNGKIVAIATETFFGLLADPEKPMALDRLFRVKGRDAARGIALLLPNLDSWHRLTSEIPPLAVALAETFWPGALTIAVGASAHLDQRLVVDGTVGVRLAGPSPASDLATAYGAPLTATSANLSGEPASTSSSQVLASFSSHVESGDLIVVEGDAPGGQPSTVVVVTNDRYRVAREGAVSNEAIAAVARQSR